MKTNTDQDVCSEKARELVENVIDRARLYQRCLENTDLRKAATGEDEKLSGMRTALLTYIGDLERKNVWVSVEERLPNDNTCVVAIDAEGIQFMGYRCRSQEDWRCNETLQRWAYRVTHWQPLPPPPSTPVTDQGECEGVVS